MVSGKLSVSYIEKQGEAIKDAFMIQFLVTAVVIVLNINNFIK